MPYNKIITNIFYSESRLRAINSTFVLYLELKTIKMAINIYEANISSAAPKLEHIHRLGFLFFRNKCAIDNILKRSSELCIQKWQYTLNCCCLCCCQSCYEMHYGYWVSGFCENAVKSQACAAVFSHTIQFFMFSGIWQGPQAG